MDRGLTAAIAILDIQNQLDPYNVASFAVCSFLLAYDKVQSINQSNLFPNAKTVHTANM